ncbi:MAG: hypothetical protein Q9164_000747 [Protoblastenia rupestris]
MSEIEDTSHILGNGEQENLERLLLERTRIWFQSYAESNPTADTEFQPEPQAFEASDSNRASPCIVDQQNAQSAYCPDVLLANASITSPSVSERSHCAFQQPQNTNFSGSRPRSVSNVTDCEVNNSIETPSLQRRGIVQIPKETCKRNIKPITPSQLSQKRDKLAKSFGEDRIGCENKIKGRVREKDGLLEWHDHKKNTWKSADYHSNWRHEFIEMDGQNAPYVSAPAHGGDHLDITSNCTYLNQHVWKFKTPEHLALIADDDGNQVMQLGERPKSSPRPEPFYWIHRGMIMLDQNDNAVLAWPNIPRCFSSALEGERMEALKRVFPWLQTEDFRSRMPRIITLHGRSRNIYGLSTLRHRVSRWRDYMQLPAWDKRPGSVAKQRRWRGHDELADSPNAITFESSQPRSPSKFQSVRKRAIPALENDDDDEPASSIKRQRSNGDLPISENRLRAIGGLSCPLNNPSLSLSELALSSHHYTTDPLLSPPTSTTAAHGLGYMQTDTVLGMIDSRGNQIDLRGLRPQTPFQQLQVKVALMYTLLDFRYHNNREPPATLHDASYASQVIDLRNDHSERWQGVGKAPELLWLNTPWLGTFDSVPAPMMTEDTLSRILDFGQDQRDSDCSIDAHDSGCKAVEGAASPLAAVNSLVPEDCRCEKSKPDEPPASAIMDFRAVNAPSEQAAANFQNDSTDDAVTFNVEDFDLILQGLDFPAENSLSGWKSSVSRNGEEDESY